MLKRKRGCRRSFSKFSPLQRARLGLLDRDDLLEGTPGIVYGFTYTYILEFLFSAEA